jgi:hypothetical protein
MASRIRNGNQTLSAAMALLVHNQAQFVAHLDEDRQRFSRIESELGQLKMLVLRHEEDLRAIRQMLEDLPEAIRQKIGFKQ